MRFTVTDLQKTVPVVYRGLLPDLFREGQGVIAEGTLGADGVFAAREVLAKHDENYMPPEVAKALKEAGAGRSEVMRSIICAGGRQRLERSEGARARCVEPCRRCCANLVLSEPCGLSPLRFAAAAAARRRPSLTSSLRAPHDPRARPLRPHPRARGRAGAGHAAVRRRGARRHPADGARPHRGADAGVAGDPGLRRADAGLRHVGLLGRQRRRQLALGQAAALQDQRRVGEPRGLDAAVGADPRAVRRGGRGLRQQPARHPARPRAGRAGADRRRASSPSCCSPPTRSSASRPRRPTATASTRCCRTPASPSIRRCSISAMSASR